MSIRERSPNDDGIRVVRLRSRRRVYVMVATAVALPVLVTLVVVAIIRWSPRPRPRRCGPRPRPRSRWRAPIGRPPRRARPRRRPRHPSHVVPRRVVTAPVEDPAGLGASPVPQPQKPRREIDAADVIAALREEGVHDGIAAFGIPGRILPRPGILVPEEFQLPEGLRPPLSEHR